MLARRACSFFKSSPKLQVSSYSKSADEGKEGKGKLLAQKAVSFLLIAATGSIALSALDDLLIYRGCSSKAMEKASQNQAIKDAIGEPIVRGPWYNATLAVAHKRHSVSCTFPVSGPQGTGIFRLKAVSDEDDSWKSFIKSRDWEILILEALLHVPTSEDKQKTIRISLSDSFPAPASEASTQCKPQEPATASKACTQTQCKPKEPEKTPTEKK